MPSGYRLEGRIDGLRPSRRPLRGLLRMRAFSQCHKQNDLILRSVPAHAGARLEGRWLFMHIN
jgi:hypothetical protein